MRTSLTQILLGTALLAGALVVSTWVGVIHVAPLDALGALRDGLTGRAGHSMTETLVLDVRLARGVAAAGVGASLAVAGCMLQSLLRDPLASPTMIGTAQASGFGRVLGAYLGLSYGGSVALSYVSALGAALVVLAIARSRRGFPSQVVLLSGVNVGMLFAALVGLVQYSSRDEGQLSRMVLFLLGGLWQATWDQVAWIAPLMALAILATGLLARELDLFALGEEHARRLGLGTQRVGVIVLLLASLLTSLAVSIAGVVAFVGLIVPHAARRLTGPMHARLVPLSALLGALLVLLVDGIARTAVAPSELPLGVLTSLIGVPVFLLLLRSMVRSGGAR